MRLSRVLIGFLVATSAYASEAKTGWREVFIASQVELKFYEQTLGFVYFSAYGHRIFSIDPQMDADLFTQGYPMNLTIFSEDGRRVEKVTPIRAERAKELLRGDLKQAAPGYVEITARVRAEAPHRGPRIMIRISPEKNDIEIVQVFSGPHLACVNGLRTEANLKSH